MTTDQPDPRTQIQRDLAAWRSTHPTATFAEIEAAVTQQLNRLRVELLEETITAGFCEEQPACPHCGESMRSRGRKTREVILQDDQVLRLARSVVRCSACGTELSPPG
jgi:tRNA(Ile2) C34 agmatinyltransferase TiaS